MTSLEKRNRGIRRTVILVLAAVAVILGGFIFKLSQPRILNANELRQNGAMVLDTPRRFSDFSLTDHLGKPFDRSRLEGKWTLIYFGFTHCPDICPTTLATAAKMYRELKPKEQEDLQVVLLSVDPERDTTEVLAAYVPYFHPDFIGVSGNPFVTLKLAAELNAAYGKAELPNGDYTMDHTGNLVLINPKGDYHGFFRPPFEEGSLRVAWRSIRYRFNH